MLKARDIMTSEPLTVSPETEITTAARLLLEHRINGLPVVDDKGRLVGIICQSDLIVQQKKIPLPSVFTLLDSFIPLEPPRAFERELEKMAATKVRDAMTPEPMAVGPESTLEDIATIMVENNLHTIPVVDQGRLVGVIGKEDVLRTLIPAKDEEQ